MKHVDTPHNQFFFSFLPAFSLFFIYFLYQYGKEPFKTFVSIASIVTPFFVVSHVVKRSRRRSDASSNASQQQYL